MRRGIIKVAALASLLGAADMGGRAAQAQTLPPLPQSHAAGPLAAASTPASSSAVALMADRVRAPGGDTLIAEGHVEVTFRSSGKTSRLKASRVIYTRPGAPGQPGQLQIEGPITLLDGDNIVILANSAELSADLRDGLMRGARMVLNRRLQLAAVELNRVAGRYTQLYKTVASSCRVPTTGAPLWQLRARRVVHDQVARQLYFDNARLQVLGLPVVYLPRLRLPDPTLKRATGFLVPTVATTSKLGFGLKTPYFITMGRHADLTLTPYLSPRTRTLEFALRKAFATGDIALHGAFSRDELLSGRIRGYLFGTGKFDLPHGFTLGLDLQTVTDPAYLLQYDYADIDRLASDVTLLRARRNQLIEASAIQYHSLRASDDNTTLPFLIGDVVVKQRFAPALLGGEATLSFETHGHYRRSSTPGSLGRDLARATVRLDWRRSWGLQNGMIASAMAGVDADFYTIGQDPAYPDAITRATPRLGLELRWPLVKTTARGATQVLEPVVQLLWSPERPPVVPNEDSTLVAFDEGNLFSFSRFPGADRLERGARANIGLSWQHFDPAGWSMGVTVGRVLRASDPGQFAPTSGLGGRRSDWLAMVQLKLPQNLSLTSRALFDRDLNFTRNETRVDWRNNRWNLSSGYIWEASTTTSEWTMDGAYKFNDTWTGKANWRFDFSTGQAAYAGLGLVYENECVAIDVSLSRRFTSSGIVSPTTSFGLSVALTGFGTGAAQNQGARSCHP